MKILLASDNFYPDLNGAARFTYQLAKGLTNRGHQVSVIAPARKFQDTAFKLNDMTVYGVRSFELPKVIHPGKIRIPLTINPAKIIKTVKAINPQIIHIQDHFMIGSITVKAGKKIGIPLVGTNHFMPENLIHYFYPPKFAKKPLSKLAWQQFINLYKHLDVITAPTKTAALIILHLGLKNLILPISCGVNLDKFNSRNNGKYLKKRYKIPDNKPIVLFVGRLDQEKNLDVLIRAFARVLKTVDATLVLAGKGKEAVNLASQAKELNIDKRVIFTGFLPDRNLPDLYTIASVFTITSTAELQSIVTLEAMASGLPIIAANAVALPELVHHGKNGYLFNQGNILMLSSYIVKILRNDYLRRKMSQYSLKMIQPHNLDKTIESYEQIYQKLITGL